MATLNTPIVLDICQFLSDFSSLTLKTDLSAGELKRNVNGVFAIAAPSESPDKETGIIYQSIEFWARNDDTAKAFIHLTEIYNFFDRRHHYSTNNYFIHFSHCESQLEDMDKDAEGAKLLKLSVRFILNAQAALS